MHLHMKATIAAITTGILTLGAVATARAELLAYEGFDYAAGSSLFGQDPTSGFGWSSAWIGQSGAVTNNSVIRAGSFTYTDSFGNSIVSSGNRVLATGNGTATGDNTGGTTGSANPWRVLPTTRGADTVPTTTWMSVIASVTSPPHPWTNSLGTVVNYGRAVSPLQMFYNATAGSTTQGSEHVGLGRGTENSTGASLPDPTHTMDSWGVVNKGNASMEATSDVGFASLPADFLLVRIDHAVGTDPRIAGQADTIYVWINPQNLAKAPSDAKADLVFTSATTDAGGSANDRDYIFNRIRLFGGGDNSVVGYGAIEVDEIRIGTEFLDVTLRAIPEPTIFALGALAGLALLAVRKLRQ